MGHSVKLFQVSGECIPLGRREDVANVAEELHDPFGCLIGQLEMSLACSFKSRAIYGRLRQSLKGLGVCGVKLRVQGEEIADCLMHQGPDFGFLCVRSVDLYVKMFEDMVDVGGHFLRGFGTVHHHAVVPATRAHGCCHGANAADEGGTGKKCEYGLAVEQGTQDRASGGSRFGWGIHGQSLMVEKLDKDCAP
jgi:hypothetical protein